MASGTWLVYRLTKNQVSQLAKEIKSLNTTGDLPVLLKMEKLLFNDQYEYYFNTDNSLRLLRELESIDNSMHASINIDNFVILNEIKKLVELFLSM